METNPPPKKKVIEYRIQREMKKKDTQFQTLRKQRQMMLRNPMMSTRIPLKKISCK
jgi:hypothetical protein